MPPVNQAKGVNGDAVNRIAPALASLVVDIDSLTFDPENARLHPEKNMEAIKASLQRYGQLKPVVARTGSQVVVAGNGTLKAARELGWTLIAANVVEMTDAEAIGFGLADNRTAELAEWDAATVERLQAMLESLGEPAVEPLTRAEIMRLRTAIPAAPTEFPSVDEDLETEHVCPRCGYGFSGGEVREVGGGESCRA